MQRRRITVRTTVRVRRTVQVRRQVRVQARQNVVQTHQQVQTTASQLMPSTMSPAAHLAEQGFGPLDDGDREFDLFLSHATENKDFARPLAEELTARGVKVWYDEMVITVGDSLRESIDRGLALSYSPTMADKAALVGSKLSIVEIADNLAELVLGDPH